MLFLSEYNIHRRRYSRMLNVFDGIRSANRLTRKRAQKDVQVINKLDYHHLLFTPALHLAQLNLQF